VCCIIGMISSSSSPVLLCYLHSCNACPRPVLDSSNLCLTHTPGVAAEEEARFEQIVRTRSAAAAVAAHTIRVVQQQQQQQQQPQ
jgi:hypothetical protein